MGVKIFFLVKERLALLKSFTFYVYFEIKKFGPYFPFPSTEEHF